MECNLHGLNYKTQGSWSNSMSKQEKYSDKKIMGDEWLNNLLVGLHITPFLNRLSFVAPPPSILNSGGHVRNINPPLTSVCEGGGGPFSPSMRFVLSPLESEMDALIASDGPLIVRLLRLRGLKLSSLRRISSVLRVVHIEWPSLKAAKMKIV
jgi:hypothetical protein